MFSSHYVASQSKRAACEEACHILAQERLTCFWVGLLAAGAAACEHVKSYSMSRKLLTLTLPKQLNLRCLQHTVAACPAQRLLLIDTADCWILDEADPQPKVVLEAETVCYLTRPYTQRYH